MNEYWRNDLNKNAMSGSELMMTELTAHIKDDVDLDKYQFVLSRPELHELDENKIRILWCHDLPEDPQVEGFLKSGGWKRFHRFVFVSNWQAQRFIERYNIPWERTVVMRNAINAIDVDVEEKWNFTDPDQEIRFCYHTTPHRGLGILVPVFEHLCDEFSNIHLDVFSSFNIYGWGDRDEHFKPIFDRIDEHDHMSNLGTLPNDKMQKYLGDNVHVFAYPSIWTETSCRSLIEAMSAGAMCIHPNNGALFETAGQFTFMYHWDDVAERHAGIFHAMMVNAIQLIRSSDDDRKALIMKLGGQKSYADVNYSWEVRKREWVGFLKSIENLPKAIEAPSGDTTFNYEVNY